MTEITVGKEKLEVPDSKVHGANTGPTWGPRWAPCRPHKPCYLRRCHHTVTSGTAYLQVAVVNSLSSQIAMSHGEYVMGAMLHARETCATAISYQNRLERHEWALSRKICELSHHQGPSQLLERMLLDDLAKVLRTHRLRWHDHIERSDVCLKKVQKHTPQEVVAVADLRRPVRSNRHGP